MEKLIKSLDKKISVKRAGTGTLYVEFENKKIRISNHEPNHNMTKFRGKNNLELYTHDLVGKEINDKYDIVERVADYLKLQIKANVKSAITRHRNKKLKREKELYSIIQKNNKKFNAIQQKINDFYREIRVLTKGREKEVNQLLLESEKHAETAKSGDKRRKKKAAYFKKEFKNRFGIEATPGDVINAIERF